MGDDAAASCVIDQDKLESGMGEERAGLPMGRQRQRLKARESRRRFGTAKTVP
jgi:hypothetical protein